jgi:signal transduction histidine kinase
MSSAGADGGPEAMLVDCPPVLPPVKGSERRLTEVLLTLLQPPAPEADGEIEVSARSDEERVTLVVTHRGALIPTEDLPALLDPFSPIDSTSAVQDDGRRLRLALAKAVVTTMGGQLTVDAQEGRGATFTVTMPVLVDVAAVAA